MRRLLGLAMAFGLATAARLGRGGTNVVDPATMYTATDKASVEKARATALTSSPTSNVKGKAFDRFVVIWNENTDYQKATGDPNLAWLASKGILLSNKFAVTHPSQPNYIAAVGGDYFGMSDDEFYRVPGNISTVIDLLEAKGISWAEYQEDMPFSGFEGKGYVNQKNGANDYVRKHNPAVIYDSNAGNINRLSQMKNLTQFYKDLKDNKLPQWMFITPNMTSDGHDTSVTVAGQWNRRFLEPLLNDKNFMKNTLVLITFDENHTYTKQNQIMGILLGDAVPKELVGSSDNNYYDHYSEIATVQANWGLDTLGRHDVGANVYDWVAKKTNDTVRQWGGSPSLKDMYFNQSYNGPLYGDKNDAVNSWVHPNVRAEYAGRKVAQSIKDKWTYDPATYYTTNLEIPDGGHPPKGYEPVD